MSDQALKDYEIKIDNPESKYNGTIVDNIQATSVYQARKLANKLYTGGVTAHLTKRCGG